MKSEHRPLSELPSLVRNWMLLFDAHLVGGACKWFLKETEELPKDWDVMIHPSKFGDACKLIGNCNISFNSFGGIKFTTPSVLGSIIRQIDVFSMELETYIKTRNGNIAVRINPLKIIRW